MPLLLVFIFSGLLARNIQLATALFYDWDEGMYAQIAKEILMNKSLFTTFNGHLWLDKPPLSHGLIASAFSIFGYSEFWSRFVFVLLATVLLALVYLLARKFALAFGKKNEKWQITLSSLLPVLVLAATPVFVERATMLNSDTLVAISWLGYFLMWNNFWGKLFFMTVGVWSKSVFGYYPLAIETANFLVFYLPRLNKFRNEIKKIKIWQIILVFLLPAAWYILSFIAFKQEFINHHFASQVLKRVTTPIELHFGNKYFYLAYLWQNLNFISLFIAGAYGLFLVKSLGYLLKEKLSAADSSKWILTLILLSPLPFIVFLTVMKTKISWYVIYFLPFLTLSLTYLYFKLPKPWIRLVFSLIIVGYFVVNFLPQTFFVKNTYQAPDKIILAQCLAHKPVSKISFLVDEDERKIKNVLEAAHYDTTSSFYYGGSPSFVFYSQKKIDYFYDVDQWLAEYKNYSLHVISKDDMNSFKNKGIYLPAAAACQSGKWVSM